MNRQGIPPWGWLYPHPKRAATLSTAACSPLPQQHRGSSQRSQLGGFCDPCQSRETWESMASCFHHKIQPHPCGASAAGGPAAGCQKCVPPGSHPVQGPEGSKATSAQKKKDCRYALTGAGIALFTSGSLTRWQTQQDGRNRPESLSLGTSCPRRSHCAGVRSGMTSPQVGSISSSVSLFVPLSLRVRGRITMTRWLPTVRGRVAMLATLLKRP